MQIAASSDEVHTELENTAMLQMKVEVFTSKQVCESLRKSHNDRAHLNFEQSANKTCSKKSHPGGKVKRCKGLQQEIAFARYLL